MIASVISAAYEIEGRVRPRDPTDLDDSEMFSEGDVLFNRVSLISKLEDVVVLVRAAVSH